MGRCNERTLQMKAHFMELHRKGLTIPQIAKEYNLSTPTVYACLQEIADQAGVSRESLLERPHNKHATFIRKDTKLKPVDVESFNHHYETAMAEIAAMRKVIAELRID